jgi:hypothetical protein
LTIQLKDNIRKIISNQRKEVSENMERPKEISLQTKLLVTI